MSKIIRLQLLPLFSIVMASTVPTIGWTGSYIAEIGLNGLHSDADSNIKTKLYGTGGTFYFNRVDDAGVVFNEAAFLNKASSASIAYVYAEVERESLRTSGDAYGFDIHQVVNDKYIIDAFYATTGADVDVDVDVDVYGLGAGMYISDTTTIRLSITVDDFDFVSDEFETYAFNLKSVAETYSGKTVVGELDFSIGENASASTIVELAGSADYYFFRRWSMGFGFDLAFPNSGPNNATYGLRSDLFITRWLAISASYALTIFEDERDTSSPRATEFLTDDTETFTLSITGRI